MQDARKWWFDVGFIDGRVDVVRACHRPRVVLQHWPHPNWTCTKENWQEAARQQSRSLRRRSRLSGRTSYARDPLQVPAVLRCHQTPVGAGTGRTDWRRYRTGRQAPTHRCEVRQGTNIARRGGRGAAAVLPHEAELWNRSNLRMNSGAQVPKQESKLNSPLQNRVPAPTVPETFPGTFWCPDLVSTRDLGPQGVQAVLHLAELMKSRPSVFQRSMAGKQMVMFFEKPSLRTRLTFEAGMTSLGGTAMFVDQSQSRLDARETLSDIAHNLERWVDVIVLRTFAQETIEGMARFASVPV